jgi:hypothetical protein
MSVNDKQQSVRIKYRMLRNNNKHNDVMVSGRVKVEGGVEVLVWHSN